MKTFLFSVPRSKEHIVDEFIDILTVNMDYLEEFEKFHAEKWRIGTETIYTIYYET